MERLHDGLLLLLVTVLLSNSTCSLCITDDKGEDSEFISRTDAVMLQQNLRCNISATVMLCKLKNDVAAGSEGASTTLSVTVTLVMVTLFYLLMLLLQLLLLLLVSSSSLVVFEQPSTVQTLGAPGSAVDTPAVEDGSSFPSAFVTFFP